VEEIVRNLYKKYYSGIFLEGLSKTRDNLFSIVGVAIEVQTEHLPNTSQNRQRLLLLLLLLLLLFCLFVCLPLGIMCLSSRACL
jgi:hypothetical protein